MNWVSTLATSAISLGTMLAVAPLLDGVQRKIAARVHRRIGPSILQGYRDLAKLFARAVSLRVEGSGRIYAILPSAYVAIYAIVALTIPTALAFSPLCGDVIAVMYLALFGEFLYALAALDTMNPFAATGASRRFFIHLFSEMPLLLAVFALSMSRSVGSTSIASISASVMSLALCLRPSYYIALAAAALTLLALLEIQPFDLSIAEQEILGGLEAEYGGRDLSLLKLGELLKRMAMLGLFIAVFLPWGMQRSIVFAPLGVVVFVAKALAVYSLASFLSQAFARFRIFNATRVLTYALALAVLSLILSSAGD